VPLDAYPWDPMPTEGDPIGWRERMDTFEAVTAARSAPRQAPPVDPHAEGRAVRLSEAHQRLDEILG